MALNHQLSTINYPTLTDLPFPALAQEMDGLSPVHTHALWRALYREGATDLARRSEFLPPLRRWLDAATARLPVDVPELVADTASTDGLTRKFLLRLADAQTIETVLMSYRGRYTACVSTQAGCAMGCVFCATGQMGFTRHLRPGEIVAQVLHAQRTLLARSEPGLRNLVLMGMGEPLHNYDSVMTALEIISDRRGLNIGPGHITISTVGVVPGILRLAEEQRPYHLAVSLHGASEEERSALVPASRRWSLAELIAACRTYGAKTGRRIFFEWTLIAGQNDSPAQAARLAALLAGIDAHVNLIPLNPTGGFAGTASASAAANEFQHTLKAANIPSTVRQRRGIDVAAGCGQLRVEKGRTSAGVTSNVQ
ncbi:radical SAM enzyme, Cfr family [Chthoniobacter flavus Ellin428]|uniref:Probable dual-specificity RNA methyltransferase RlmN n=1 Tax=Chthoniobacter flavus Ellin428 TaxID=497964 RepID=B4D912_9BACT|nr:23S rRNA (adenine(2503)-C(2))-methyltransferase RlmN [Chthoniobacter flavus]EDY17057.1 radical SAM enzyme, Cfr family [Chthoniobacter flavus Ellin428]TCO86177.1 23S rRNA (adenine2503-C2)-methyltransferase [Chthoniobacter flavus]